ncbi:MAG: hypothetical protein CMH27_00015 [Micavibrio sp.]|nr:hypothetical protein [Micavibrio sp.]|tara:strand:+ start:997 stop:1881 length:885 start_codon:yes stop_codon:yes gene_type:complete
MEFPAILSESEVFDLASALEDISEGHISRRIDHDDLKPWFLQWYFTEHPTKADIASRLAIQAKLLGHEIDTTDLSIEPVPDKNWLEEVYQGLKPFNVGPFFIYGSHYNEAVPDGMIGMQIDAATAFGSGDHGTTKGCLQAMLDMKGKGHCPWNVLDMGTGSGILSIAAWKLWQTPITAIDNDAESVRVAEKYRDINGVNASAGGMTCAVGDGFQAALCQQKKPYDLIIANILAGPLIEMAPDVKAVCDELGQVILSGMLRTQAADVRAAYEAQGFTVDRQIDIDKWSSLVLLNK